MALYREHIAWAAQHAGFRLNTRSPIRTNRLRVAYISPHLRRFHPVLNFLEPVLAAHHRSRVHITCYSDVRNPDDGTQRLTRIADLWRDIAGLGDEEAAALIRADQIDILVDLAGHLAGNRLLLLARKPAPVQVTWLGYPNSTGLSTIDYRLTDPIADPPGAADHWHSEKLSRLESGFLCYQPPEGQAFVCAPPVWFCGWFTFGCFQYPGKITSEAIRCWARILSRAPHSRLVLHHCFSDYSSIHSACRNRIVAGLVAEGVEPHRVTFLGSLPDHRHLELYSQIDLMLDTFPYNGTTTTCEALWMGVPVITLSGLSHVARVGESILTRLGLSSLIAHSQDQYILIATTLARDIDLTASLRMSMRERFRESSLFRADQIARTLENAYDDMARA